MTDSHIARWWTLDKSEEKILCELCPRYCRIPSGKTGYCNIRRNENGVLIAESYGKPIALQIDPIEKKPLAEFLPGTRTFSLGTFGCNLGCVFCQNYQLSIKGYSGTANVEYIPPERIVELALENGCQSISFTYNEPTIFGEYVVDIAECAHKNNLKTVLVTNGYITREAAECIYPHIDAANIDMKGFSEEFYISMTKSHLKPVLESIEYFFSLKKHLEITNLIIPEKNDMIECIDGFFDWIDKHLNKSVPLHFSAYHPDYNYHKSARTPAETLYMIRERAIERGFSSIYLGNI